ncbi:supervillin [Anabrus simplex]|uniref:supervillin n=1 Tax=Anabrus simplex TaxID=316456 RepID=UPI0035A3595E
MILFLYVAGILKYTRDSDSRRTSLLDSEKETETESENEVRGILKTGGSGSGTQTPELESFRHLKSVLKKECSAGDSNSESCEIVSATNEQLRSILKRESTEWASQEDDSSSSDSGSSSSESSEEQPVRNAHVSPGLRSNLRGGSGIDLVSILHDVEAHARKQRQALSSSPNNKQKLADDEKLKNIKNLSQEKENQKDTYVKKKLDDYLLTSAKKSIDARENHVFHSKIVEQKTLVNQRKTESKQVVEDLKQTKKMVESHIDDKDLTYQKKVRRQLEELQHLSSATETTPPTSDGDTSSSGGREVRRIIRNEAVARRRQAAINKQLREQAHLSGQPPPPHLVKSQSHSSVPACGTSGRQDEEPLRGLQRSSTQPLGKELDTDTMSGASIRDRMAALQKSGTTDWKKRLSRLNPEDDLSLLVTNNKLNEIHSRPRHQLSPPKHGTEQNEDDPDNSLSPGSILADRLGKLDAATQGWKKRVGPTDAVKFSVAGRMLLEQQKTDVTLTTLQTKSDTNSIGTPEQLPAQLKSISSDRQKRTPRAARFRSKTANLKDTSSTPVSPQKESPISFKRSISAPGGDEENGLSGTDQNDELASPKVTVPRADDETFTEFYRSITTDKLHNERLVIQDEDLDNVVSQSNQLLVQKRTVKIQRRNMSSRNPIKALAARTDLQEEYIEVKTGLAEKELKRIKVEKLAKHSSMAVEALAGLASKEDFTAVALKKATPTNSSMLPYKDLMLLHIKGRRHVQTRLVQPVASSINDGDNYVLVTPTEVYNWVGRYSNVIERSRGAEVAQHIQQRKDLGCSGANQIITISNEKVTCSSSHVQRFWSLLGAGSDTGVAAAPIKAGHPDEDELYETSMIATNMVFEVQDDELVPIEDCWGSIPRISILDPAKILVFDFGSELYVWNGKNASLEARRSAQRLARELWEEGFDYSECDVCPLNIAASLGVRKDTDRLTNKGTSRPSWALLAKVNQHMETILFREKFLDWPDFSRVIRSKSLEDSEKQTDASIDVKPCDAKAMLEPNASEPDLELEGAHLGRGLHYYDPETHRHSEITTLGVTVWHILEYEHTLLPQASVGQFHAGDSYVVRWQYSITITGRELGSGQPSRHSMLGRDRCAYFCWQGEAASLNEQGAAALLTVELDHERGPQVRVVQGAEPPAFLNLFNGCMVVHNGRREPDEEELEQEEERGPWKLYISRGETDGEIVLVQVSCSMRQLRSRACLVLINTATGVIHVWYGAKASKNTRQITRKAAEQLKEKRPLEIGFKSGVNIVIIEHHEGSEKKEFFEGLGGDSRQLYMSLVNKKGTFDYTPRLFHLTSVSGVFTATEVLGPYRHSKETVAYPFLQADLYSASQPALFLLDNYDELWLWQGWWPENGDDSILDSSNQTGSGAVRWQAERRAAMQTAVDYWRLGHPGEKASTMKAYLVWAGLEPLRFTNLFPMWTDRDDIAEISIRDGKKPGEVLTVEAELARLTRSTYPPAQLLQRPLPDGVDPTRLEIYLDPSHFQELLGMTKEEFQELPVWKQKEVKKEVGLF